MMVQFVTQAAGNYGGLTNQVKLDIVQKFMIGFQRVDKVIHWVHSLPVDDSQEYLYTYYPQLLTSGTQDEITDPALGAS